MFEDVEDDDPYGMTLFEAVKAFDVIAQFVHRGDGAARPPGPAVPPGGTRRHRAQRPSTGVRSRCEFPRDAMDVIIERSAQLNIDGRGGL
jgi:hypothetical protein